MEPFLIDGAAPPVAQSARCRCPPHLDQPPGVVKGLSLSGPQQRPLLLMPQGSTDVSSTAVLALSPLDRHLFQCHVMHQMHSSHATPGCLIPPALSTPSQAEARPPLARQKPEGLQQRLVVGVGHQALGFDPACDHQAWSDRPPACHRQRFSLHDTSALDMPVGDLRRQVGPRLALGPQLSQIPHPAAAGCIPWLKRSTAASRLASSVHCP